MPISLSFHSPQTHTDRHRCLHRKSTVCFLYLFHTGISTHNIDTDTHTCMHDRQTHAHKQNKRARERPQTPKPGLIPRGGLWKGFLKLISTRERLSRSALFVAAALPMHSSFTPSPPHSATSHFWPSLTRFLFQPLHFPLHLCPWLHFSVHAEITWQKRTWKNVCGDNCALWSQRGTATTGRLKFPNSSLFLRPCQHTLVRFV